MSGSYNIEAAAKISGISINAIRYWMRKGLLKPVVKGEGGEIVYFDEDSIKRMKRIKILNAGGCSVDQIIAMLRQETMGY